MKVATAEHILDDTSIQDEFKTGIYTEEEKAEVKKGKIPEHIALIMDGNRRWAKNQGLPVAVGHFKGVDALVRIVPAAIELGIKTLTVYSFSTENWKRDPLEIKAIMSLLKSSVIRQLPRMLKTGVALSVIGDLEKFPEDLIDVLTEAIERTRSGNTFRLVLALNYGGRDEIRRAIQAIVEDCLAKKLLLKDLSEETISSYLDTAGWNDPDLVIRTSGESRLSNFLLWQVSNAEVIISKVFWPEYGPKDLLEAVGEYQRRELRWGR